MALTCIQQLRLQDPVTYARALYRGDNQVRGTERSQQGQERGSRRENERKMGSRTGAGTGTRAAVEPGTGTGVGTGARTGRERAEESSGIPTSRNKQSIVRHCDPARGITSVDRK